MICLIVHDSRMYIDEYGNYYKVSMGSEHYSRYFQIANKVKVIMRVIPIKEEMINKVNSVKLKNFEVISCPTIMTFKGLIFNRRKAKKIIKQNVKEADFLIIKMPGFFGNIAYKYAIKYNKPYLIELGACPWDALWNHGFKGKLIAPYQFLKTKQIVKNASHVMYVTNNFLQKRYPTNGKSTNCSNVMLTEFNDELLEKRLAKIRSTSNKIVLGTTAAVNVKYKGQRYVIEALGRLKEQGIDHFEYQLVGGGDQNYLKEIAKKYGVEDKVVFLGSLPHHQVFDWLDTIDVYVQPSLQEGLPRALIEAMSRALPAFGANTGGIPELLEAEFIFSKNKSMIDQICSILKSFNKENLIKQAIRNYNESKKYNKLIIENRRKNFYRDFARIIKTN